MADGRKRKGKHPEKALNITRINALKEPGRYVDGNGLYLVVDPSGAKRWLLRTVVHGKRSDIGLGGLSLISLAEAREEAIRLRKIARNDGDPLAERRKELIVIPTFKVAATQVHQSHSVAFRNEKHKAQWITTLETYAFPKFGDRRVDQISSADVLEALSVIWNSKPETARRVRQRIKTVFEWCKAKQFRTGDNPVEGVSRVLPKHKTKQDHHAALAYAAVPEFLLSLIQADAGVAVKLAFEFLILTAARTGEVIGAKWGEISEAEKTWVIPAVRMKAGVEHRVPLCLRTME